VTQDNRNQYDPHTLVWALLDNSILEHQAGYCTEVDIYLHSGTMVTLSDNGRGIPVSGELNVQTVLTGNAGSDLSSSSLTNGNTGISAAAVNALSHRLFVEIRREGTIYRQDYMDGIPQSGVIPIGSTKETGTSVTLEVEADRFNQPFDRNRLEKGALELTKGYPGLKVQVHSSRSY